MWGSVPSEANWVSSTANLRTEILDFGGFDSSRVLTPRGGILMSIGNFPESLSRRILAGIILVGRLGVLTAAPGLGLPPFERGQRLHQDFEHMYHVNVHERGIRKGGSYQDNYINILIKRLKSHLIIFPDLPFSDLPLGDSDHVSTTVRIHLRRGALWGVTSLVADKRGQH